MLLCVILVWPTKFENSLYFMQNVLEAWEFKENWLNILILGKLGSKQVFLKSNSSYTHAFCSQNSMLWGVSTIFCSVFQKKNFRKILAWLCVFRSIESIFQSIENAIKISRLGSVCFDWSKLIFDQSKIV